MSGRRGVVALLPVIAGVAVAIAAAAWFLRDAGDMSSAPYVAPRDAVVAVPRAEAPREESPPPLPARPPRQLDPGRPAWTTLHVTDASTRRPISRLAGATVVRFLRIGETELRVPEYVRRMEHGVLEVVESLPDKDFVRGPLTSEDLARGRYRLRVPGYRAVDFESRDALLRAAKEITLQPLPVSARGVLVAGRGVEASSVWVEMFPAGPTQPPESEDPPYLPTAFGPFELHELAKGRWRLEARARMPQGVLARATREFEVGAEPADLGEIRVLAPTTLRARVVARDGTAVLDPGLTVTARGDAAVAGRPGEDGWTAFAGLDPGATVKVASSLPGLEQEVVLPSDGGDEARVELLWDEEGVRCRLRFLVDGSAPTRWGDILEGPELDKGAWKRDGFLEHEMAPGDYLFGIQAELVGKSGMRQVWAKFTVPRQPTWMADVSFSEEPPR